MKYVFTSLFLTIGVLCNAQNPADSITKYCRFIGSTQELITGQKIFSTTGIIAKTQNFQTAEAFEFVTELEAYGLGINISEFSAVAWKYISKQLSGQSGPLTTNPNNYNVFLVQKEDNNRVTIGHIAVLWDGTQWTIIPIYAEKFTFPSGTEFRIFSKKKPG